MKQLLLTLLINVCRQLLWFKPGRQLSSTQLLIHSPRSGTRDKIGRVKVRKLVG